MKKFKSLLIGFLLGFSSYVQATPDLLITPVNPMPAQSVESTVISNIKYQLTNLSVADSYSITFSNLENIKGKSFTTTCGTLAHGASCDLNITFTVPALPVGKTSEYYPHTFFVLGTPSRVPYPISTTIVQSQPSIAPTANVSLQSPGICSGTFTITFTGSDEVAHEYDDVACGVSTLSPGLPGGTYTAHIAPATVTSGSVYDAPADFSYHLAKAGDTANFVYVSNPGISVNTNLTMPNAGSATSTITCTGTPAIYGPHDQSSGTTSFDTMKPGNYTCTATNYTGTDAETYTPTLSNPYTISALPGQNVIAISFTAIAPASQHVKTNITAPNLQTGQTVNIKLIDGDNTYNHDQPAGLASFDNVVEASDYNLTCANYTVGSDTYACTPSDPYTVDATHTEIDIVYKKLAPPGVDYDWTVDHLSTIVNANVHAIYWGGGSTTAPLQISSNPIPNQFLLDMIAAFELSPTAILTSAHVQNFPTYLAQGSVSEFTTAVTDQMKTLKLDMNNHYEGNGDGNAGCAFDSSPGYQFTMNPGTGSAGTVVNAGTYNVFTDYYIYSTVNYTTNITAPEISDGATINIKMVNTHGDTYVQNVAPGDGSGGGVVFDNILPGSYTVTAASYVGKDSHTYNATLANPYTVNGGHAQLALTYSVQGGTIAPSTPTTPQKSQNHYYDGTINSITNTGGNNYTVAITFAEVPLHSNPNLSLIKVQALPAGSVITYNLTAPKIYYTITGQVNVNFQVDGLCKSIWYSWGGYTPQVDNIASQAKTVTTTTGHNTIAGSVVYVTRNSDSFDNMLDDVTNDYSLTFYMYNLLYEGYRMQYQYTTNAVDMVLLLNPDSTNAFQNCTQYYCPFIWEKGLTQDTVNQLIAIPNLQADLTKALARMVTNGYLSSGQATAISSLVTTSGILVPPPASGRTVSGVPELYLLYNLLLKQVAPNVPFGYGQNIYDNANPLMAVGTPCVAGAPWETGSVTWLHKINHLGYSSGTVSCAINFEADKYAKFLKDMNYMSYTGDPMAAYKPDFVFTDIYERDPMPSAVGSGFLLNGVDLDTYFAYWTRIAVDTNYKTPLAIWQIPGASLQIQGTTLPNALSGTWPDYVFGHTGLKNDMSNLATSLNYGTTTFVGYLNTSVYFTANSGVSNAEDYIKLTSASAFAKGWVARAVPIAYGEISCSSNMDCYKKLANFYNKGKN